jgi:hypothetical protein
MRIVSKPKKDQFIKTLTEFHNKREKHGFINLRRQIVLIKLLHPEFKNYLPYTFEEEKSIFKMPCVYYYFNYNDSSGIIWNYLI